MKSRINEIIDKKMKYEVHDKVLAIANRKRNSCVQILRLSFSIIVLTIMLFMFMNNNYAKYDFKDNIIINERKSMGGSKIDAIAIPIYNNNDYKNNEGISEYKFYKDIELLRKADTGEALWLLREKTFIDSPYHEEDLKLFVEATTKLTKHAIATVASSADSIKSPYHQEDMKMIATANSNCLSNGLNTGNGMDKLAINKVSLADKYHSENMRILSKNPKNKNYLCELMTNPDIVNGENYRKEIDALLNAKSSTTGKALYCYISNPNEKISYMGYPMIEKNSVAGNNDSDYLNNLIKINEMDDRFVVDFAILLMNPNFINSQYNVCSFKISLICVATNNKTIPFKTCSALVSLMNINIL